MVILQAGQFPAVSAEAVHQLRYRLIAIGVVFADAVLRSIPQDGPRPPRALEVDCDLLRQDPGTCRGDVRAVEVGSHFQENQRPVCMRPVIWQDIVGAKLFDFQESHMLKLAWRARDPASANPVVFVSYPSRLAYRLGQLGADLRKRGIEVIAWPRELDRDAVKLTSSIERHNTRSAVLLLALSPAPNHSTEVEFFARSLPKAVQPASLRRRLRNTFFVTFTDEPERPSYANTSPVLDMSGDYAKSLEQLIESIGSPRRYFRRSKQVTISHVSGSFEVAKSSTEMFDELQKEIGVGAIDQKYLYWDVRAAERWNQIVNGSTYMTGQSSMNLLAAKADSIIGGILDDVEGAGYSFINFGVGTGVKDYLILQELLAQQDDDVLYFPVDESLPMIQITIQDMQELIADYGSRLTIHYILDDFVNVAGFSRTILEEERTHFKDVSPARIIAFLGGSLGNFSESSILTDLKKLFGSQADRGILGVEFIAGRGPSELIANYNDPVMKRFLYGPILDVEGIEPDWDTDFRYEIVTDRSEVPGAQTVVGTVVRGSDQIELFQSTKYERAGLEEFLSHIGFDIVDTYLSDDIPERFAKYVLKLSGPESAQA